MKKLLSALLALAMLLCSLSAAAEGQLYSLVDSARTLLYSTENVTLSGHAEFSLDGERFKTADILYMQSGASSHWQLDLLTPRRYREDQHTGYTIVANGEKYYVMEHFYPGTYKSGTDLPNSTVLRRTVWSDRLASLALSLADPLEALLPENALALSSETEDGRELSVSLSAGSVPPLLNDALQVAAEYALLRFMGVNYEDLASHDTLPNGSTPFGDYDTVTAAVLYGTDHFALNEASVRLRMDAANRLQSMGGSVSVLLSLPDGQGEKRLDIAFDLAASGYGATSVPEFDPDAFHVVLFGDEVPDQPEVDPGTAGRAADAALECLKAAGYKTDALSLSFVEEYEGMLRVVFSKPENTVSAAVTAFMNAQGNILNLLDGSEQWYLADPHEPPVVSLAEDTVRLLSGFMSRGFPDLASRCAVFTPLMEYTSNGVNYLYVVTLGYNGEDIGVSFILREDPEMKIIEYSCLD
ncbi:MAG: hypothetical protein IKH81_04120 [Clostridia bacterium]|nr:hypothetical protein [Clostridia bacterium]